MSVASRNPFALLDEDASRPASPSPAAATKQAAPAPAPTRGTQKPRGGPASRGGRYYQRGGKSAPRDKENAEAPEDASGEPRKRAEGEVRGRGRGRGRGDRGRGGRGRQFDRHSATGKTDSDKKVHQGWGGDEGNSELKAEAGGATDAAAETTEWDAPNDASGWDAAPVEGAATTTEGAPAGEKAEARKPREPEEEDNTLTLDEYRKKQGGLDIVPKLEGRKVDDSAFKGAVVVTKKDEDEAAYFVGKSKPAVPKAKAKKEEKVFIEIDARFERPARGGRGRGGDRGGERGARGRARGAPRGRGANGPTATTLNVDDEKAFPSLA
ncbi:hypothetical protein GSI_06710 [Ganoderma sinense ZZ0214-1]|uniref:Hyaluronan/mRNA-binding protein domain-containing protein n=1 Tax=Ganoderma sinense ZZ0214-1 TaxID=1077348 RepID=A0A2G8SE06_9APHY|nr:hypothetical protein GSI_06710 [Ganoderma sinense ZZ0214-1]